MAKLLKLRRGTTAQHSSFTGAEGECTVDMDKDVLVVHDGSTAGGHPVAAEDMANVSSANILGRIGNGDIVGTKLENSGVTAAQYGSSSAIPIVTVDAQGLVTAASTAAIDSTTISNGSASVAVASNGPITSNANHDFSAGIDVTGDITATGHVTLADDKILKLGDGTDFELVHQSSNNNSIIRETGGGNLSIQTNGNNINLFDSANTATLATFLTGGEVKLYHAGNLKIATASDGVDVTGSIDATTDIKTTGGAFRIDSNFFIDEEDAAGGSAESPDGSTIIKNGAIGKDLHLGAFGDIALGSSNSTANTVAKFQMPVLGASKHGKCFLNYVTANAGGSASSANKLETKSTGVGITGTLDVGAINATGGIYTTGNIGRDATDMLYFTDNTQLDVYINNSNEFRFEADGDFHADGDIVAYSSTTASDSRLKSDIHTINDALGIVGKLRGVSYKWLRDGKADIGVIAQEVEKVVPEIVKTKSSLGLDGPEEIKTVDYGKLVGVLINAINELKAELDEHKKGGK